MLITQITHSIFPPYKYMYGKKNNAFSGPSELEIARENELKIAITQELSKALKTVQKENVDTDDLAVYRYLVNIMSLEKCCLKL